jgi:uncharacterized protein YgbK (DUF1537 family)
LPERKREIALGCVCDDFTGAGDAASFLAKGGLRTVLCNGIPDDLEALAGSDAVVIALKTRGAAPPEAVSRALGAFDALRALGAESLYFKYCSTFDSTPNGNIGPVADAVLDAYNIRYTPLCPSLPVNGRTVRDGRLYVNGVPLDESPMRAHPLNPMWSSDIRELMKPQSKYPCFVLTAESLAGNEESVTKMMEQYASFSGRFYVIPDYFDDFHGKRIADLFGGLPFLTGGSGLLEFLAEKYADPSRLGAGPLENDGTPGRGIILCGSCSEASREQIRAFKSEGGAALAVDPAMLMSGELSVERIWSFVQSRGDDVVLVHSADINGQAGTADDGITRMAKASAVEDAMRRIGRLAVDAGYKRVIVAGGETSGAVIQALGLDVFVIGQSVAPGVPVMTPALRGDMRIVLKSGNFGQPDFFKRALYLTGIRDGAPPE